MREESAPPPGAQSGDGGWEAPTSERPQVRGRPSTTVGTPAAARACQGLGFTAAVLPTDSPKPGKAIALALGLGPGEHSAIPAGISHPTLLKFLLLPNNDIKAPK